MERCLTQWDAACLLRCSTRTLERMRLTGVGPRYIKTTHRVLYRESDLEAWLADRSVRSTSEVGSMGAVR
jgi:Helix-turn-helix domain